MRTKPGLRLRDSKSENPARRAKPCWPRTEPQAESWVKWKISQSPVGVCVVARNRKVGWDNVPKFPSSQPRSGGYEVSPARDRGPQAAPLLCELGWLTGVPKPRRFCADWGGSAPGKVENLNEPRSGDRGRDTVSQGRPLQEIRFNQSFPSIPSGPV